MKRLFTLLLLLASLHALAQSPVIRAHLEPSGNVMVGQPVRLSVTVFVPNYFTGSPDFPEFEIENAIVILPQDRPQNTNTQIGSNRYAGITQTYVIYPQQAGDFHVPPAKISVTYAIAPPKSTTAEIALPALSFHAAVPAAARDLPYFLPTTRLIMTEHWSRPLKGLRTGDTVERTITVTASKMQAMLIPPLEFEQPAGIRIYTGEPSVRDQKTPHGDFVYGQRIQTAQYLIEKPGDYTIPPIKLQWWNLSTRRLVTAMLPATKFTSVVNRDYKAELPPSPEVIPPHESTLPHRRHWLVVHWRGLLTIILFLVLLFLVLKLLRQLLPHIRAILRKRRQSEAAHFRQLLRSARHENAEATYYNLLSWLTEVFPERSLDDILRLYANAELKKEVSALTEGLFSKNLQGTSWCADAFARGVRSLRHSQIKRVKSGRSRYHLGALNP